MTFQDGPVYSSTFQVCANPAMSDPTESQTKKVTSYLTRSNFIDFEQILKESEAVTLPTYTHKTNVTE